MLIAVVVVVGRLVVVVVGRLVVVVVGRLVVVVDEVEDAHVVVTVEGQPVEHQAGLGGTVVGTLTVVVLTVDGSVVGVVGTTVVGGVHGANNVLLFVGSLPTGSTATLSPPGHA